MQRNAAALASAKEPCVVLHDEIKSIQSTGIRCKGQLVALKRRATLGSGLNQPSGEVPLWDPGLSNCPHPASTGSQPRSPMQTDRRLGASVLIHRNRRPKPTVNWRPSRDAQVPSCAREAARSQRSRR